MAAIPWARVPLEKKLPTLSHSRFYPTRSTSFLRCSNGPQRADTDSSDDWDAAWEKLKEQRRESDGASGEEITKATRSALEFDGKDSNLRDARDVGPRFTKWGGSVRGGKYRLGEGADRILEFWGNGEAALYAAMSVLNSHIEADGWSSFNLWPKSRCTIFCVNQEPPHWGSEHMIAL